MSKKRRPYDPYSQKRNIRVPYTYFSRAAVKKQNRRFWGVGIPAIALAFATLAAIVHFMALNKIEKKLNLA